MKKSTNSNNYENQKIRGLKRKLEAIKQKGGKCEICGYNKNISALDFHHINPIEKEFQIDIRHFSNNSIEVLQKELNKCQLLCANCHRELHNPEMEIEKVEKTMSTVNTKSFSSVSTGSICPICGNNFSKTKGKIYCSKECKEKDIYKDYPSINEVNEQYKILKTWDKVAKYFGLTRKIVQGIRFRAEKYNS